MKTIKNIFRFLIDNFFTIIILIILISFLGTVADFLQNYLIEKSAKDYINCIIKIPDIYNQVKCSQAFPGHYY